MAHSISAEKRNRQSQARQARNRWSKRRVHTAVKSFDEAVLHSDKGKSAEAFQTAVSTLDRVAAKGAIHPNKAARKKSRMAKKLNALKTGAKSHAAPGKTSGKSKKS